MSTDSAASSPRSPRNKEDLGLKAVLKELRSEYHQINAMEARIQNQRVKWMQQVETWLDRQEQIAVQHMTVRGAANRRTSGAFNGKRISLANAPHNTDHDTDPQEPSASAATSDPHALTTFHDGGERRPGPRPCPPPQLPELDDAATFEPEFPKAGEFEISGALQQWEKPLPLQWDEDGNGNMDDDGANGHHYSNNGNGESRRSNGSDVPEGRVSQIMRTPSAFEEGRRISKQAEMYASPVEKRIKSVNRRSTANRHSGAVDDHPHHSALVVKLQKLIMHPAFDSTCAFMIIFNSAIIGVAVQWLTQNDKEPSFTMIASHVCSVFFLTELVLRMSLYGKGFFTNENRGWNIFDFALVFISIVDFVMGQFFAQEQNSFAQGLKTIKMLRIIRVFRVFRFFRELSLLALMIVDSLYSLTWALILLMIIIYVFSICFTSMATDYMKSPGSENATISQVEILFGSLTKSIYTLVLSMLNGVSWGVASDALMDVNMFACGLFLFYAAFTLLAVMNIITGVFVDNAVETARNQRDILIQKEMELKEKYASEMRGLFSEMDKDGSGTISYNEVQQYLQDPRVQGYFAALGLDPNDTERLFRLIDDDGSGDVDVGEFLDGCIRLKGQARSIDVYTLMRHVTDLEKKFDFFCENLSRELVLDPEKLMGMPLTDGEVDAVDPHSGRF